jgi:hypothetical protein
LNEAIGVAPKAEDRGLTTDDGGLMTEDGKKPPDPSSVGRLLSSDRAGTKKPGADLSARGTLLEFQLTE